MLLLYPTRLLALNAVSHAPVQDIALAGRGAPGYAGQPLALATDPSTAGIYLYTSVLLESSRVASVQHQCRTQPISLPFTSRQVQLDEHIQSVASDTCSDLIARRDPV